MINDEIKTKREKIILDHFSDEVKQDWDSVLSTFPHPRYELIPQGIVHDGLEQVMSYYIDTRRAFPDQHHEIIKLRHSDDAVIVEFWLMGTHKGYLGKIPPTNNEFRVRMTAFFIFEGDTLIVERIYFDALTMLKQLIGKPNWKKPSELMKAFKAIKGAIQMSKEFNA